VRKFRDMWACRRVCGGRWGLGPSVVHWLYTSVIRPPITYACMVCLSGCETARDKRLLSTMQRLASLRITGAVCTTPTNAVEALVDLPPLDCWYRVKLGPRRTASGVWEMGLTLSKWWSQRNTGASSAIRPIIYMRVGWMRPN
jgi:hypothetical protein